METPQLTWGFQWGISMEIPQLTWGFGNTSTDLGISMETPQLTWGFQWKHLNWPGDFKETPQLTWGFQWETQFASRSVINSYILNWIRQEGCGTILGLMDVLSWTVECQMNGLDLTGGYMYIYIHTNKAVWILHIKFSPDDNIVSVVHLLPDG